METRFKNVFKDHVATVIDIDEDTQILKMGKEGTRIYSIEFVFRKNYIYVSGDVGSAVFNTTWKPKWDYDWERTGLGYFASKCECCKGDIFVFDEDAAIQQCKEYYKEGYFYSMPDDEYERLFEYLKNSATWDTWSWIEDDEEIEEYEDDKEVLKQMFCVIKAIISSSSVDGYIYTLQSDHDFEDFNDFFEFGYGFGKELNSYFEIWLLALRLAKKQLE